MVDAVLFVSWLAGLVSGFGWLWDVILAMDNECFLLVVVFVGMLIVRNDCCSGFLGRGFAVGGVGVAFVFAESLILAQDERWRRA